MAFDQGLAQRIEEIFEDDDRVETKKMFGGLCFMVSGHMCCGIVGDTLMARVGAAHYVECLAQPYVREMNFTGKALKGMVYVDPEGIESDESLRQWIDRCRQFVSSLPPK